VTRESVSRTLSVHTEHELLLALEKAGIARVAQAIIESPNNALAKTMMKFCKDLIDSDQPEPKENSRGNGYDFSERVRVVLRMAREEASRLHHEYVGTEHLLLGLIKEGEGVAALTLMNLGIDNEEIVRKIEATVKFGKDSRSHVPDLPYTSRAKKVLELAMGQTRDLDHSYVGTEHLLLGLINEEKGIAAQFLTEAGVTYDKARAEILRILSKEK